jgi:murein DD-endopeptidase MepM/ murein hydrolase activator NlpD
MANLAVTPSSVETVGLGGPDPLAAELTVSSIDTERKQQLAAMHRELQRLELGMTHEEGELKLLSTHLKEQQTLLNFTPSVWPVRGWISSHFGYRVSPFTGRRELHKGLDIVNRRGTPVVVTADGRVVFAGYKRGYGKMVIVDHGLDRVTKYGHLSEISVQSGDQVTRGQKLGLVGSTGRSTGPHLHYEVVVNGKAVDPVDYLLN